MRSIWPAAASHVIGSTKSLARSAICSRRSAESSSAGQPLRDVDRLRLGELDQASVASEHGPDALVADVHDRQPAGHHLLRDARVVGEREHEPDRRRVVEARQRALVDDAGELEVEPGRRRLGVAEQHDPHVRPRLGQLGKRKDRQLGAAARGDRARIVHDRRRLARRVAAAGRCRGPRPARSGPRWRRSGCAASPSATGWPSRRGSPSEYVSSAQTRSADAG